MAMDGERVRARMPVKRTCAPVVNVTQFWNAAERPLDSWVACEIAVRVPRRASRPAATGADRDEDFARTAKVRTILSLPEHAV